MYLLVAIIFLLLTQSVWATERFARPDASGGLPCAEGSPCSLATCVNATNAGDICTLLDNGSPYTEPIRPGMGLKNGSSWNPGSFVTIRGKPGQRPRFTNGALDIHRYSGTPIQFIHFENFVADGGSGGIFIGGRDPHDIRVYNVEVKNTSQSGIQAVPEASSGIGCERIEWAFLDVHNNGSGQGDHGVYNCCKDNIYRDSKYYNNSGYGMQIYWTGVSDYKNEFGGTADINCNTGTIIKNNYVHDNNLWGVTIDYGNNVQFYNNIVTNSHGGGGLEPFHHVDNLQVYNNTFYGNLGPAIVYGNSQPITNTKIRNNIMANNGGSIDGPERGSGNNFTNNLCWQNGGSGNSGNGCTLGGDPKFANAGMGNFSLQDGSAAIGQGAPLASVPDDFAHTARTDPYDIGAYETGGGVIIPPDPPPPGVKAFPSAEGYGVNSIGGRGGITIEVTNLLDDGNPGSLRYCVEQTVPRTCVFTVGGTIPLNSPLRISGPNLGPDHSFLTIAGQTAPGGGIQTKNWYVSISYGAHDVIIRHFKVRSGTDHLPTDINNQCGGIVLYRGEGTVYNVILDHVSIEWSCDDSLNMSGLIQDTTVQWSIIGEGMNRSDYCSTVSPFECANSKGFLAGDTTGHTISFHHNMMLDVESRIPAIAGTQPLDFRNNLVYNWYACTAVASFGYQPYGFTQVNFVGNKFIFGPNANSFDCAQGELDYEALDMYATGNSTPWCERDNNCATATFTQMGFVGPERLGGPVNESQARVGTPFTVPAVTTTPVANLEALLVSKAGATVPIRDPLDSRLINEMQTRTGTRGRGANTWPTLAAGTPPVDTDHDGMPDSWETPARGLNPNNANDAKTITSTGYSNLENYINQLAGDDIGDPIVEPPLRTTPGIFYVAASGGVDPPTRTCDMALNTLSAPLLTLNAGRTCANVAGDKVFLRTGTYTDSITTGIQSIANGVDWTTPTTIGAYQMEVATISLPATSNVVLYFNGSNHHIVLDRLIVDCHNQAESNGLAMTFGTHHIRFQNGEIKNCYYEPVYIENSDDNEILTSLIHGSTVSPCINLVTGSDNTQVIGNTIHTCGDAGISASNPNSGTIIRNNQIRTSGANALTAGINSIGSTNPTIINNIVWNSYVGVALQTGTINGKIYNNTLYGNTTHGIRVDAGATGNALTNNIATNNTTAQITIDASVSGSTPLTTNLTTNPGFVDPPNGNFRLVGPTSAAINTGTTLAVDVPKDYENVDRPEPPGGQYDIGASEFVLVTVPGGGPAVRQPYWRSQGFFWK